MGKAELTTAANDAYPREGSTAEVVARDPVATDLPIEGGARWHVAGAHRGREQEALINRGSRWADGEGRRRREGGVVDDVGRRATHLHGAGGIGEEPDLYRFGPLGGLVVGEGAGEAEEPVGGNRSRSAQAARAEISRRDSAAREGPVQNGARGHIGGPDRGGHRQAFIHGGGRWGDGVGARWRRGGVVDDVGGWPTHLHGSGGIREESDLHRFGALAGPVVGEGAAEAELPVGGHGSRSAQGANGEISRCDPAAREGPVENGAGGYVGGLDRGEHR